MEPEYEPQMRSKHTKKIIEKNVVIFLMDSSNDVHLGGRGGGSKCAHCLCALFVFFLTFCLLGSFFGSAVSVVSEFLFQGLRWLEKVMGREGG